MALLTTHGGELREPLDRGVGPIAFVARQGHLFFTHLARVLVLGELDDGDRHDLGVEPPRLLSGGRALLARQCVLVLRFARDVVAPCHHFRGVDHREIELGLALVDPRFVNAMVVEVLVLHERDRLHPARDHDRHTVHDHAMRGHGDGLHAR